MNESLRLTYSEAEGEGWKVEYCLSLPTPAGSGADNTGWSQIDTREVVDDGIRHLGPAVKTAKDWAGDSGFKVGAPKIAGYGSLVTIKLSRP